MKSFDHKKIEKKWLKRWLEDKIYEPVLKNPKHFIGKGLPHIGNTVEIEQYLPEFFKTRQDAARL